MILSDLVRENERHHHGELTGEKARATNLASLRNLPVDVEREEAFEELEHAYLRASSLGPATKQCPHFMGAGPFSGVCPRCWTTAEAFTLELMTMPLAEAA